MKVRTALSVVVCSLVAIAVLCAVPVPAQDTNVHPPQKYLYLSNISIRPNMTSSFITDENAEVQALRAAGAPLHYIGMRSITGSPRALFFAEFDSYAELQKNHEQTMSDSKLQDALKADDAAEAPLLGDAHGSIYKYRDDLSLNPALDISLYRFFDITAFHVRSGHYDDFEHLVKLYMKAYAPIPNSRWAIFEKLYGEDSDRFFILVTPLKSLADEDQFAIDGDNLPKVVGQDQLQLMRQMGSETVETAESDLFAIIPQISYVPDSWLTASPDFWGKK